MIDKISGKIAYAVVSFGGFLGMGEEYFPIRAPSVAALSEGCTMFDFSMSPASRFNSCFRMSRAFS